MFTIVQRIGAIPRAPARPGHHNRGTCGAAVPHAETGAAGTGPFSDWLARARNARLLTEGL